MDTLWPLGRLYLAKDEKRDIYVDYHIPLAPHQRDGIRLLFRHFKKAMPGVILNDPSGYGKCVQVVSFLNAIRCILTKPILVLCETSAVENWKEHFEKYTDFSSSDIAPETANLFENYSVFIKSMKDALCFSRRNWSVVVVHDNVFSKDRFQTVLKADFKIWVTSFNMQDNLNIFASIYEWIHPNTKVNVEDFKPRTKDEVVEKSIYLDAYLDDIVIRRSGFLTPFQSKPKVSTHKDEEPLIKVSRKNKDPTGKKVKRSKKRRIDDNEMPNENVSFKNSDNVETGNGSNEINGNHEINKVNDANCFDSNNEFSLIETNNDNTSNNKMDVESFIQNENVIKSNYIIGSDVDTTSQQSVNLFSEPESSLNFQNYINDLEVNENENDTQEAEENLLLIYDTNNEDSNDSEDYVTVNTTADEEEARLLKEDSGKEKEKKSVQLQNDIAVEIDEDKHEMDSKYTSYKNNNGEEIPEPSAIEAKVSQREIVEEKLECNGGTDLNEKDEAAINIDEGKSEINSEVTNKSHGSTNNIDDILAKFERDALKKFKGSVLDRLF